MSGQSGHKVLALGDDSIKNRLMYTDSCGASYDIEDMRDALVAIRANTAPNAVSLSPRNRIRAIYEIACQALP
jgi:LmbE family N-acetylglucosaminyl deacetylase